MTNLKAKHKHVSQTQGVMGTRGYIIVRAGGKAYAFYRQFDTYPEGWGLRLIRELIKLIRRFGGDVQSACQFMIELFSRLKTTTDWEQADNEGVFVWDECKRDFFEVVETVVREQQTFIVDDVSEAVCNWRIEFLWTFDFDRAQFAMDTTYMENEYTWSMKHLYRVNHEGLWLAAAEDLFADERRTRGSVEEFKQHLSAAIIQHAWRRSRARTEDQFLLV